MRTDSETNLHQELIDIKQDEQSVETIEDYSTIATKEDIENGITDEYGVIFSSDGTRLLKATDAFVATDYKIKRGTKVICDGAFSKFWLRSPFDITSITIPNTLIKIGNNAFARCIKLNSITIHNGLTTIKSGAFFRCKSLTEIRIPNSVVEMGAGVFYSCENLTSIIISNNVIKIGKDTFAECTKLSSITIPNSVSDISLDAFNGCENLTSINVEVNNSHYCSIDGVLFDKEAKKLILYLPNRKDIDYGTPDTVTEISTKAFLGSKNLKKIVISENVNKISIDAFDQCENLEFFGVVGNNKHFCYLDGILYDITATTIIKYPQANFKNNHHVHYRVTEIGVGAFEDCKNLTSIKMDDRVTKIADRAFKHCDNLSSIIISNRVTEIGDEAFSKCDKLNSITLYDGITKIGQGAFSDCTNLNFINLPNSITEIGESAFEYCRELSSIVLPNSLTKINKSTFLGCKYLTSITIPASVLEIGEMSFSDCSELNFITIPRGVIEIGKDAFHSCGELISINVDANNKNYSSIEGILFDKNANILIQYPQGKCESTYQIPNSVTKISDNAFDGCVDLISITIPASVIEIGELVFHGCKNINTINIDVNNINFYMNDKSLMKIHYNESGEREDKSIFEI